MIGFVALGEDVLWNELIRFLMSMLMMNIEVSALTFFISSVSGRNRMGLGLGASLVIYTYDLIGRVVPKLKDYLFIGPFSYSNASEIFAGIEAPQYSILLVIIITIAAVAGAYSVYTKRDLAG